MKEPSPWEGILGQIYLGSKEFVSKHQPDVVSSEVPRQQTQILRPPLEKLFRKDRDRTDAVGEAFHRYGYQMKEIALLS